MNLRTMSAEMSGNPWKFWESNGVRGISQGTHGTPLKKEKPEKKRKENGDFLSIPWVPLQFHECP